jgi:hypothetical protein
MEPTNKKKIIVTGSTASMELICWEEDDCGNRSIFDATGFSLMELVYKKNDGTLVTLGVGTGLTVVDIKTLIVKADLSVAQTDVLKSKAWFNFDLEVTIGAEKFIFASREEWFVEKGIRQS